MIKNIKKIITIIYTQLKVTKHGGFSMLAMLKLKQGLANKSREEVASYKKALLTLALVFSSVSAFSADDSAQQALQQLKMLQQKLSSADAQKKPASRPQQQAPSSLPTVIPDFSKRKQRRSMSSSSSGASAGDKPITAEAEHSIDELAFDKVTKDLFPMTPEQILRLRQMYNASEFAQAATPGTPPRPTATSQFVNLSPGSTPPAIRLAQGFVSSLVFLDSTGAPWPISAYDLGNTSAFNIQWDKKSNTLMIQSLKLYTYGNLAVRLQGLNTPVMLTLVPGQKAVDYRVDLRVQGYGPNASNMPVGQGLPASANNTLLHVLDGVPPAGSKRLVVKGGNAKAWSMGDKMYVRTNLTILSPGWLATMTSGDGTHAYEMQKSPVLLVSWHGKVMQLKLEGF
jgi:intracellular multiplication protein IcmK